MAAEIPWKEVTLARSIETNLADRLAEREIQFTITGST